MQEPGPVHKYYKEAVHGELSPRRLAAEEQVYLEPHGAIEDSTQPQPDRLWGGLSLAGLKLPLIISLLNQCVSSGGNFLLSIYLARTLSLSEFGLYGIGYGLCMLYIGVGNSLVLTQMLIHMPSKEEHQKEAYAAKMLNAVLLLGLLLCALVGIGLICLPLLGMSGSIDTMTALAIMTAASFFLVSEFFISYAYLTRQESLALLINCTTMITLLISLLLASQIGLASSAGHVLLFYAGASALSACIAYLISPLRIRDGIQNFRNEFAESWHLGRWALGGVCITWVQSQAYAYIALLWLGPVGVGQANIAKIFISPFSFLLPAINKVALPRLADLRQVHPEQVVKISSLLTLGMTSLSLVYSLLLMSSLSLVMWWVIGRQDAAIQALIGLWCVVLVLQMIRAGGGVLLQVERKFKMLTLLSIPSAALTLLLALLLIQQFGTAGAIWSMAVGECSLAILIWREILRETNR